MCKEDLKSEFKNYRWTILVHFINKIYVPVVIGNKSFINVQKIDTNAQS